ncbi:hypothetical protein [Gemmobacter aquatilis]|uniref:hypothetical protein n=1 Tax=Gemmobacter aquatilis TaxID=933059 RepID=UPI001113DAD5|nr:hypothetical protein [Gemmobacter aquatilis]
MARLVTNRQEAVDMIHKFQNEARSIEDRLSHVRAWYACKDHSGKWLFGASKFIGYHEMDAATFLDPDNGLDGRKTEKQLQEWFDEVPTTSALSGTLHEKLASYLDTFGKVPSRVARINVLREPQASDTNADLHQKLVDMILLVARTLPDDQRRHLKQRMASI